MSKFTVSGRIEFDPGVKTKKQERQSSWKKTAMVVLNDETSKYYSWFLRKRFGLQLNPPIRGPHFTVINDRIKTKEFDPESGKERYTKEYEIYLEAKEKWNGKEVEFTYDSDVRTDEMSWWLPVKSEVAMQIREDCGLGRSFYGFHLTIGRADHPLMIEHSKYVLRTMIKYGV